MFLHLSVSSKAVHVSVHMTSEKNSVKDDGTGADAVTLTTRASTAFNVVIFTLHFSYILRALEEFSSNYEINSLILFIEVVKQLGSLIFCCNSCKEAKHSEGKSKGAKLWNEFLWNKKVDFFKCVSRKKYDSLPITFVYYFTLVQSVTIL